MLLILGIICVFASGCMSGVVPDTAESRLVHASNDFAFDLLKSLKNEKNLFISPFSISTTLALMYLGAEGTTARIMRNVLKYDQFDLTANEINQEFQSFLTRIKENSADYQLSTYDSVLLQQNFHVMDAYKQALQQFYSAKIENVNFADEGERIRNMINNEVESATEGKIKNFLDQLLDPRSKLFLLNAVYFLGNWKKPFDPYLTHEGQFFNDGTQEKQVQMMSRDGIYEYAFVPELNSILLVLPYKGDRSASMIILSPLENTGISQLEQLISQDTLLKALETTQARRIIIHLPKFNLTYSADLQKSLSHLGLQELFGSKANLSGIALGDLQVSSVFQKAVIEVNERGSEAASATGVEIIPYSQPPSIFIDHPFLFFIRDNESGMILFSGRVNEL